MAGYGGPLTYQSQLAAFQADTRMIYTGVDLTTVTYRTGGLAGSIVATLTLAYTSNRLDSVERS